MAESAVDPAVVPSRQDIDISAARVVLAWYIGAVFWLLVGSALALVASVKMHAPYFLADTAWLTFGRVRPAHLNTVIYGWASMSGVGTLLWLQARLARVRLPYRGALMLFSFYWHIGVAWGTWQILAGRSAGVEWLEFPGQAAVPLGGAFVLLFVTSVTMLLRRRSEHVYVSQWYLFGASLWFPCLYVAAMLLMHATGASGMVKGIGNWWYAHNVLGLWLTPIGVASAYYTLPKILGRPVHSYHLSVLGFWTLALFYNWAGTHHLIGGPLPAWLVTVGIVGSLMMFVPVITVAINHHLTMVGHFHRLASSPSLRFTVVGAMIYTLVSLQGSLTALRSVNRVTHFTHYTIAHAHLGVYGFYSMIMFGSLYYVVPRLTGNEWASAGLIRVHFWGATLGLGLYVGALTVGGIFQGLQLNLGDGPFMQVVARTSPYLQWRSVAGLAMTLSHLSFAVLMWRIVRGRRRAALGPTLFRRAREVLP